VAAVVAARLVAFLIFAITERLVFTVVVAAELVVDFLDHKPVALEQFVSSGRATHVASHQLVQETCNA
jgi:hypothetical protein